MFIKSRLVCALAFTSVQSCNKVLATAPNEAAWSYTVCCLLSRVFCWLLLWFSGWLTDIWLVDCMCLRLVAVADISIFLHTYNYTYIHPCVHRFMWVFVNRLIQSVQRWSRHKCGGLWGWDGVLGMPQRTGLSCCFRYFIQYALKRQSFPILQTILF